MKPSVKYGLITGVIGLVVIVPVSAFLGVCGPLVTLVAGAFAGFFTAYAGKTLTRREGWQTGAIAGAISGGLCLIGQIIGGIFILTFIQKTGTNLRFGSAPGPTSPISEYVLYYLSGLGTALCFGIVGIVLGAVAGGIAGALGTRQSPPPALPANPTGEIQ